MESKKAELVKKVSVWWKSGVGRAVRGPITGSMVWLP